VAQLRSDYDLLRGVLQERHPGLDRYRAPGTMQRLFAETEKQLGREMTMTGFMQTLAPLIDSIDCGHTEVQLPKAFQESIRRSAKLLPFKFHCSEGQVFILLSYAADTTLGVGMRVHSINGLRADSLAKSWSTQMTSDGFNETMKDRMLERLFRSEFAAFAQQGDSFRIAGYYPGETKLESFTVESCSFAELDKSFKSRYEKHGPQKILQLAFRDSAAVLTVRSFQRKVIRKSGQRYRPFMRRAFREIRKKNCSTLIIDLRDNTGGEVPYGIHLYRHIARTPFRYIDSITVPTRKPIRFHEHTDKNFLFNLNFLLIRKHKGKYVYNWSDMTRTHHPMKQRFDGQVLVLTNGMSFSNSSNFAAIVQEHRRGLIVGEEPGGAMNGCNGSAYITLTLPESKLQVRIPLAKISYPFQPYSAYGRGALPDVPVEEKIEELVKGKDVVMERALKLSAGNGGCTSRKKSQ